MGSKDSSRWFYAYLPMGIAGGATSALIPLFAYALGGSLLNVGIIAAATSIASVPSFMLWGSACDRIARRKPFLLIGFLGSGVALVAMAASRTLSDFYLSNLLAGLLGAASGPAGRVLLMEGSDRKEWPARLAAMSRMTATGWAILGIYVASQVTSIAIYPRVADWVSSRGSRPMQLYGTVGRSLLFGSFFLLGLSGLAAVPRLALVLALHAGVGACWAVINVASSTLVSRLAPEGGRARSLGAFNAVQGFGSIFGPLLGGALAGLLGYGPAFAGSLVLVLAGSAVLWATRAADA